MKKYRAYFWGLKFRIFIENCVKFSNFLKSSGVAESVVETAVLTSDLNPGFGYAVYFTGDFANHWGYAYQPKVWGRWFSIKKLGTANYGTTYTLNNDGDYGLNYYILYK